MTTYFSNGKLLLTGEYVVLDGALALALPTNKGQALVIEETDEPKLGWKSLDHLQTVWYEDTFDITTLDSIESNNSIRKTLVKILRGAKQLNPSFLNGNSGYNVTATLEFDRDWGLGSSSTLIANIANWACVDAYKLLELSFGGSGYDIACAQALGPLTYQLKNDRRSIKAVSFNPSFST